jgi:hypothetical protein
MMGVKHAPRRCFQASVSWIAFGAEAGNSDGVMCAAEMGHRWT